ncbi:lysine--tRNA ligase [Candidatus Parcubacteria bacterium]|nr:lysine--tRNA ligase [Candidatus Parcubacteria bacterium]
MSTVEGIRKTRLKKLKAIQKAGLLAYPLETKRTHTCLEAIKDFNKLSPSQKEIVLTGRIRSMREHGGSTFLHIEDSSSRIQAYFKKDRLGEKNYKFFLDNFDIGDFIEVRGILFKTKRGEKTLEVSNYKILAKALLSLPEKWHGLKDVEERYRKRYLDLIFNPGVKEKFILRAKIIKEIRDFLEKKGFLEVETPILQPIYGGAKAKPFKTHLNALNMDLFLRIAPELQLKKLLVGGFEKVYEIGRLFRNEGMDREHNPEYTSFELYWTYKDYKELMKFVEEIFQNLVKKIFGKLEIEYEGKKINFKTPWPRIEFSQIIRKYAKINLDEISEKALTEKARKLGVKLTKGAGKAEIADEIFKKFCRPKIWQPCFIIHYPLGSFPLSKQLEGDKFKKIKDEISGKPKLASFQLIIAGWEIMLGFSELNDPLEQRKRFEKQEKLYKKGFEEAQRTDKDFLEALEYGMPPAAGFGMGIDRLVALLTNSHSLREVILFPTMKRKGK